MPSSHLSEILINTKPNSSKHLFLYILVTLNLITASENFNQTYRRNTTDPEQSLNFRKIKRKFVSVMDFELRRAREKPDKEQRERKERAKLKLEKERKAKEATKCH